MRLLLPAVAALSLVAAPALAQEHDHGAPPTGAVTPPPVPPAPKGEHEGHEAMDHSKMDHSTMDHSAAEKAPMDHSAHAGHGSQMMAGTPPPKRADTWAADAYFGAERMAAARKALFRTTSTSTGQMIKFEQLEWRLLDGHDAIAWDAKAWFGSELNRLVIRSEGEAEIGGSLEKAELRALWSHAISPYFNLEMGVRHDIRPRPSRIHATVGVDGMLPYWIEFEGAVFLSDKGDFTARAELSHDMRLTQSLILQPSAELNFSAQDVPELGIGSGLTDMELGLRLRYAPTPNFGPYIGVNRERQFGDTARFSRVAGSSPSSTSFVAGIRFWF